MRKPRSALKNPEQEVRIFRNRSLLAVALVILLSGCLVARLVYLQIVQHEVYTTRSESNRVRVEPLPPTRGLIYDRNGRLLAENRPTYNLTIVPERVDDLGATLDLLVDILDLPEGEEAVFRKRAYQRQRPYQPALLMSELDERQIARLAVNRYRLPGVEIEGQLLRYYPDPVLMSHVLGYVGRINVEELAELDSGDYAGTHFIGKTGVEKQYEAQLHGDAGLRQVETNARGRVLRELGRSDPETRPGHHPDHRRTPAATGLRPARWPPWLDCRHRSTDRRDSRHGLVAGLQFQPVRDRHQLRQLPRAA